VVLPEFALLVGAFGGLGGLLSVLVDAVEGQIPDYKLDLALIRVQDLIQRFVTETLAERSLVVGELDDGH
jgi:hypothetical protein